MRSGNGAAPNPVAAAAARKASGARENVPAMNGRAYAKGACLALRRGPTSSRAKQGLRFDTDACLGRAMLSIARHKEINRPRSGSAHTVNGRIERDGARAGKFLRTPFLKHFYEQGKEMKRTGKWQYAAVSGAAVTFRWIGIAGLIVTGTIAAVLLVSWVGENLALVLWAALFGALWFASGYFKAWREDLHRAASQQGSVQEN